METSQNKSNLSEGINLLYIAEIVSLAATVLALVANFVYSLFGNLGNLVSIAVFILQIMGLLSAGKDDSKYQGIILFKVVNVIVSIIAVVVNAICYKIGNVPGVISAAFFSLISTAIGAFTFFQILGFTNEHLNLTGSGETASLGSKTWIVYLVKLGIAILAILLSVVGAIINISALTSMVGTLSSLAGIAVSVMSLLYYMQAKEQL